MSTATEVRAASSERVFLRRAAMRAAAHALETDGRREVLQKGVEDASPRVRREALLALLALTVDAQEAVALPVPGSASGWVPAHLTLDGTPLDGLRREGGGGFLTVIPAGRHQLLLSGPLPSRAEVELPLPLRPRQVEVHVLEVVLACPSNRDRVAHPNRLAPN